MRRAIVLLCFIFSLVIILSKEKTTLSRILGPPSDYGRTKTKADKNYYVNYYKNGYASPLAGGEVYDTWAGYDFDMTGSLYRIAFTDFIPEGSSDLLKSGSVFLVEAYVSFALDNKKQQGMYFFITTNKPGLTPADTVALPQSVVSTSSDFPGALGAYIVPQHKCSAIISETNEVEFTLWILIDEIYESLDAKFSPATFSITQL